MHTYIEKFYRTQIFMYAGRSHLLYLGYCSQSVYIRYAITKNKMLISRKWSACRKGFKAQGQIGQFNLLNLWQKQFNWLLCDWVIQILWGNKSFNLQSRTKVIEMGIKGTQSVATTSYTNVICYPRMGLFNIFSSFQLVSYSW